MNNLPSVIEDLINDYKYQMEHKEKMIRLTKELLKYKSKTRYFYTTCYFGKTFIFNNPIKSGYIVEKEDGYIFKYNNGYGESSDDEYSSSDSDSD